MIRAAQLAALEGASCLRRGAVVPVEPMMVLSTPEHVWAYAKAEEYARRFRSTWEFELEALTLLAECADALEPHASIDGDADADGAAIQKLNPEAALVARVREFLGDRP